VVVVAGTKPGMAACPSSCQPPNLELSDYRRSAPCTRGCVSGGSRPGSLRGRQQRLCSPCRGRESTFKMLIRSIDEELVHLP
jgi:hypothetical protein